MSVARTLGIGAALVVLTLAMGNLGQVGSAQGVLAWIPCADEDEEYAHVVEALRFTPRVTRTRSASELSTALGGIGVLLIPEQEDCSESTLAGLGRDCASVLRDFLGRGGKIVGMTYLRGADDILRGAGILPDLDDDEAIDPEKVRVVRPEHPLAAGVSLSFTAEDGSTDFTGVSRDATVIVRDADGDPVVFEQSVGRGTVIMLGFDFYEYNADMARLLRNAVGAFEGAVVFKDDFETCDFSRLPWRTTGTIDRSETMGRCAVELDPGEYLELTYTVPEGTISFWRNVDSGEGTLVFFINGREIRRWSGEGGEGENVFVQESFPVTPGSHTFRWEGRDGCCPEVDSIVYVAAIRPCAPPRVAVLDEIRQPGYFTGGVSNSYDAALSVARERGLTAERITAADIAAGKLDLYTTLVLPDNAPPVEVVDRIVAWWSRGNHLIVIDSGITFVLYAGILFPELKGKPAGDSKPSYWTYDSGVTTVVRKAHPLTAGHSVGQELRAESDDALLVIAKLPAGVEVLAVDKAKPDQAAVVYYQGAGVLTFIGPDEDILYLRTILGNALAMAAPAPCDQGRGRGVLAWIPCADEDEEYAHVVEALRFTPRVTRTRSASELSTALGGIGVLLIPEQEDCSESTLAGLGRDCASVLRDFLGRGGKIVGMTYLRGADDILRGAGILPDLDDDEAIDPEKVRVVRPEHPLAAGVSLSFTAEDGSTDFTGVSRDATVIVRDADGDPVVFEQSVGRGTVIMLGFDFYEYNADMARLLRNAVASAPSVALLLQDASPWETDVSPQVFRDLGIPFDIKRSTDLARLDLSAYCLMLISSDQPQSFYDALASYMAKIETYVRAGGTLVFLAADDGWNDGKFEANLPGGVEHTHESRDPNRVALPAHPVVRGVPSSFEGGSASHAYFASLPPGAKVITVDDKQRPTTIEYRLGLGLVIASGVTVEWAVKKGLNYQPMLSNIVQYAWELCWSISGQRVVTERTTTAEELILPACRSCSAVQQFWGSDL